jgi:hypothetical protein
MNYTDYKSLDLALCVDKQYYIVREDQIIPIKLKGTTLLTESRA